MASEYVTVSATSLLTSLSIHKHPEIDTDSSALLGYICMPFSTQLVLLLCGLHQQLATVAAGGCRNCWQPSAYAHTQQQLPLLKPDCHPSCPGAALSSLTTTAFLLLLRPCLPPLLFCSYTSKYVSVRVQNVHVKLSSWDHAVDTLATAEEGRKPYWCSLIEQVQHPDWWPATGHVPTYDQVSGVCFVWAGGERGFVVRWFGVLWFVGMELQESHTLDRHSTNRCCSNEAGDCELGADTGVGNMQLVPERM